MAREAARTVELELRYHLMTRTPSTTLVEIATKAGLEESRTREVLGDAGRASSVREIERGLAAQGVLSVHSYILDRGPVVRGLDSLLANL